MDTRIDKRNYDGLIDAINLAKRSVYKDYLTSMGAYPLVLPNDMLEEEDISRCIRMFHLKQLTIKPGEDIFQKLSTVYHATMAQGASLFIILDAAGRNKPINIYMGTRIPDVLGNKQSIVRRVSHNALKEGILGNFPGSKIDDVSYSKDIPDIFADIFDDSINHVSAVSTIASARTKEKTENKDFVQGLEKLIEVMSGKTYTAILIAEPVSSNEQIKIREGYESLYSTLSCFGKSSWSYNEGECNSVMETLGSSISNSIEEGISHTNSHTESVTLGTSDSVGIGINVGMNAGQSVNDSSTWGKSNPTDDARNSNFFNSLGNSIDGIGDILIKSGSGWGIPVKAIGAAFNIGSSIHQGESVSESITSGIGKALGITGSLDANYSHSWNRSNTNSDTTSEGTSSSKSQSNTESKSRGTTKSDSEGRTLQIEYINKSITEMLNRIDEQIKRLKEEEDFGAYNCGAYFLSDREENCILAANTYRALMIGDGSSIEKGAVTIWNDADIISGIKEYLRHMAQPVFAYPMIGDGYTVCTPGTIVSGAELPLHLGLPTKSVVGMTVTEHAEFGRNIEETVDSLDIGTVYHMGQPVSNRVFLDKNSLSMHVFVTGSTGSGKSNTVYKLIEQVDNMGTKFMVIEPAKGEYKTVFGHRKDVSVFGTNPAITPLLRINPFSFPDRIHILEHLDRLVEIFNVCWPMYAAMPAVLKNAIEKAYIDCGWNMVDSTNKYDKNMYPGFLDIAKNIKDILNSSEYDAENKGAYKGALLTRLQSLTNGINGMIFSADEISTSDLFDRNVIVDLSRVGASETKSLIMGMLILKLQEYRMSATEEMNADLRHITILEEAHNLLRRTSTEQSNESSNILGKSVEMIANSISEMRTYGEGFVIADQAPGLMDMSVIRNTNTKIIMRLPDKSDRELVGRAANLNDDQLKELAKLPCGVAAIYQNEWLQPVLCNIDKYEYKGKIYTYNTENNLDGYDAGNELEDTLLGFIMEKALFRYKEKEDLKELKNRIICSKLDTIVKVDLMQYISAGSDNSLEALRSLIYDFLNAEEAIKDSSKYNDVHEWVGAVVKKLKPSIEEYSKKQIDLAMALIINEKAIRDASYNDLFCRYTEIYRNGGGVF